MIYLCNGPVTLSKKEHCVGSRNMDGDERGQNHGRLTAQVSRVKWLLSQPGLSRAARRTCPLLEADNYPIYKKCFVLAQALSLKVTP